jgi:hypothetical protein
MREIPVPWVPYPLTLSKLKSLLVSIGFYQITTIYQNNRFYILQGKKP